MNESSESTEEQILTLFMILLSTGVIGSFSLIGLVEPIQLWAVQHGLVVSASNVDMPLAGDGSVGFDMPRMLIAGGILGLVLLGLVYSAVRKHRKRNLVG